MREKCTYDVATLEGDAGRICSRIAGEPGTGIQSTIKTSVPRAPQIQP